MERDVDDLGAAGGDVRRRGDRRLRYRQRDRQCGEDAGDYEGFEVALKAFHRVSPGCFSILDPRSWS